MRRISETDGEFLMSLYKALLRHFLEHRLQHQSVMCLAELQQEWTLKKAVGVSRRMASLSYVRRLQKCSTCLTKQRLRRNMIILYKHVKGINVKEGEELFMLKENVGTGANGYKLAMNKNRQKIREE